MADFAGLHRWERFAPDIGDNRQRPEGERLWLEIKSSMTRLELVAFDAALKALHVARSVRVEQYLAALKAHAAGGEKPDDDTYRADLEALVEKGYAAALAPAVRLVGRHTLSGKPCETLEQYLAAVAELSDGYNILELAAAVRDANTVGGSTQLFSSRRSGGWVGTHALRSAEE